MLINIYVLITIQFICYFIQGPEKQAQITESMGDVADNTQEDIPPYLREEPPEGTF